MSRITLNEIADRHRRWSAEMLQQIELMEAGKITVGENTGARMTDVTARMDDEGRGRREELERVTASYADRLD